MVLGFVVLLLQWYSDKNHGLSPETSAIFGWKFAPTLVAVLYTQLTAMLFDDIRRTEPFARLARPSDSIPKASRTILETPREWWTTLAHGFDKQKNGGRRSWVIILAYAVNVLAFLTISPISSALLGIDEVSVPRSVEMIRLVAAKDSPMSPFAERDTYFRATGALLQNVSTSPWLSDDYAILPFWPTGSAPSPWDRQSAPMPQTWEAETTVFRNNFKCSQLDLAATGFAPTGHQSFLSVDEFLASIRLESTEGCQYNLTFKSSDIYSWYVVVSWSDIDHFASRSGFYGDVPYSGFQVTHNEKCGDEAIILSTAWLKNATGGFLSNLTVTGYACSSDHTMATIPVEAAVSSAGFTVNFDTERFLQAKQVVPETLFNHSQLLQLYTDPELFTYIPTPASFEPYLSPYDYGGVAALLATQYGFNLTEMQLDASLPEKAARIRKRFFGEILRTSLSAAGASDYESVLGTKTALESRVFVSFQAAYVLAALFFISFFMLLFVTWTSRIRKRPLNLAHDPATVLGTAAVVASNNEVLSPLEELHETFKSEITLALEDRQYATSPGRLHEICEPGQTWLLGELPP